MSRDVERCLSELAPLPHWSYGLAQLVQCRRYRPRWWWSFRVGPQCRAAVWLRWSSARSAKVELQQTSTWSLRGPMTEERLVLAELLEKAGEGDFLRAVAGAVLRLLMESDVEGVIGAGRYERSGERTTWRNGYRDRRLTPASGRCNC